LLLEGHRLGDRSGGERRFEGLEFLQVGFGLLEVRFQTGFLLGIGGPPDLVLELLNLLGEGRQLPFDERDAADPSIGLGQVLPGALGGDDLQVRGGPRIDFVALPVVPVKMGVDDRTGFVVTPPISRSRARAAEGLEWESTTTTPSSVRITAAFELTL
jgi:hypothetical protein